MNMTRNNTLKLIPRAKSGIHIKKSHRGLFTKYCNGKVTNECIQRGKNSPDPKIRKRATFAANARRWKHQSGGFVGGPNFNPNIVNEYNNNIDAWKSSQAQQLETQRKQLDNNNKWASFGSNIAQNIFDLGLSLKQTLGAQRAERNENNELTAIADALKLGNDTNLAQKVRDGYITHKQAYEIVNPGGTDIQFDDKGMLQPQNGMNPIDELLQKSKDAFNKRQEGLRRMRDYNDIIKGNGYNITESIKATKKGGLIKKSHRPFGHISVLDDTGKVDPKTLKLKKNYGRSI